MVYLLTTPLIPLAPDGQAAANRRGSRGLFSALDTPLTTETSASAAQVTFYARKCLNEDARGEGEDLVEVGLGVEEGDELREVLLRIQ